MKLLNLDETCAFLRVKKSWIRNAVFRRKIPFCKIGHLIKFDQDDLVEWLKTTKHDVLVDKDYGRPL